ncbi:PEGA domain-containing protein [Sandaracinus amylolyticus]|uniref:PEGA domain-containing protein n=1 Tax=Sandaracinus amylolyticus TaxID=927083 RepID=UPI001F1B0AFB|nr:PEGA domain-containing protein [Sandaracinus amylolyticus]UJR82621.1 Hypothetical protein I5071_46860 [Sandaracinus amylolyticus]
MARAWALVLAGVIALGVVPARADAPHVVWIASAPEGEVAGRARRWQRRVARALERAGAEVTIEAEQWVLDEPGSAETRVARLADVERLVREAHDARAELDSHGALARLADAERIARSVLDVPGASAWYAEVQIALAVTAAELGQSGLAEAALARASTIDPSRVLGAAEAPPALVARAASIARAIATGPRGRFELRTDVPGAIVSLDGRVIGEAPARIETSVGAHVLRVDAPGHRAWARLVDVLEGARAPIAVTLAPEPVLVAARSLRDASDAGALEHVASLLAELSRDGHAPRALWLVEASAGATDRALVVACRAEGCSEPVRIDVARVESALPHDPDLVGAPLGARALADARAWLDEPIPVAPPPPPAAEWWQEPWPWVIAGVVIAGAIGATIGATWPEPQQRETLIVDGREPWGVSR